MKTILFLCGGYRSIYSGSFIHSLLAIEEKALGKYSFVYVFHKEIDQRDWCRDIINKGHIVETIDFDCSLYQRIKQIDIIVRKYGASLIHVHFGDKLAATIYGVIKGIVVIWHIHTDNSYDRKKQRGIRFLKNTLKEFVGYKLIGRKAVKVVVSSTMITNKKDIWIPNGLALNRIKEFDCEKRQIMRRNNAIEDDDILLLMFGWSLEIKGLDIAFKAVRKYNRIDRRIKLAIVCGPDQNIVTTYLKRECGFNDADSFVKLLLPIEDVYLYYNIADIFISASRTETFSYALLEALSIGKPCIVSDISGTIWCHDFNNVEFFESESPDALVKALDKMLNRISFNKLDAEGDINLVRTKFSVDIMAEKVTMVYDMLLERKNG